MKDAVVTLREYQPEDFERLWQLDQECFRPGIAYSRRELSYYISRPRALTIVAQRQDNSVCGFAVAESRRVSQNKATDSQIAGHIITIDVLAGERRSGVGSMLMNAIEARLRPAQCDYMYLEVAVDNLAAISFYKRHGYSVLKTLPRYYDGNLDGLRMGKKL